ncbi:hypothetical protein SAMN06265365_113138 [Tistlia consotensis]|uniref:Uncharacterized protein n=1 Tax=Tistlia consotensis USBA 355 TaxID=560819 RepID=A0A1Y6C1A2_9PROT|nr:hypothetical protein [Tistlia consotensis]SMF40284.1 hypothetical protein SAMN05428998_1147 [Tistlia consotensis USBA 355]SNR75130.1 hypothetical protein SAMN06265365_113138 [Tistlia consotensis]
MTVEATTINMPADSAVESRSGQVTIKRTGESHFRVVVDGETLPQGFDSLSAAAAIFQKMAAGS